MKTKTTILISLAIILIGLGLSWYYAPLMPDQVALHWNAASEVDGHMPKFWGLMLMPIVSLALLLLFILIPKIDPLKANVEKFRGHFNIFIIFLMVFLVYIHFLTLFWNIGNQFNMGQAMIPALGILFYYCGILIKNAKRNWFIGIRTPWTLSSDAVWEKTHRLGSKLFKAAGVIVFISVVLPRYSIWLVLIPIIFASIYTIIYSYVIYQKEKIGGA